MLQHNLETTHYISKVLSVCYTKNFLENKSLCGEDPEWREEVWRQVDGLKSHTGHCAGAPCDFSLFNQILIIEVWYYITPLLQK